MRSTGGVLLFFVVTFGIYNLVYLYKTHEEMKRYSGDGIGGVFAVVIAVFAGMASPFLLSSEVGTLHERTGRPGPVSALTGLWTLSGLLVIPLPFVQAVADVPAELLLPVALLLLLAGPLVWFVQTNVALNDYWRTAAGQ